MKSNQQVRQGRVKMFAAVMGGSAVVAMGALSVALHEEQAPGASGGVATGATFIQGSMTMGQTATTTTPPAAPVTSIATPPMTATTPAGFR
jgi:outer membrane biosynthesis protein TonB